MSAPSINQPVEGNTAARLQDEERPDQTDNVEPASPNEGLPYIAPATEDLLLPPNFKPFFTLIEDAETGDVHHPTVHYVFSDDDPDLLTSTALKGLETDEKQHGGVEDRYLLLDVGVDGKSVEHVSSFSPNWRAMRVEVSQAPSWSGDGKGAEKALMLRITGKETVAAGGLVEKGDQKAGLEALVQDYDKQLEVLEELLG
ncbi:hypothetical protein MBLNU230_g2627t1 [Neophaeotheca triangularis]